MCIVYYLYSTKDNKPRYVGQTRRTAEARLCDHLREAATGCRRPVYGWIRSSLERGYQVRAAIIDANAVWNRTEREMIARWRKQGFRLFNILDGGDDTLEKFIARKKARKAQEKREREVMAEVTQPPAPVKKKKKRKKAVAPAKAAKKRNAQEREWMYGKLGAASDVRVIYKARPEG